MTDQIDLDGLERLAKAATAGKWRKCGGMTPKYCSITSPAGYIIFGMADAVCDREGSGKRINAPDMDQQQANAAYIASANPATILALISQAREAERMRWVHAEACDAADHLLAHVTAEVGRYLYDSPDTDLVPLLAEAKVTLTAGMWMRLYKATDRIAPATGGGE